MYKYTYCTNLSNLKSFCHLCRVAFCFAAFCFAVPSLIPPVAYAKSNGACTTVIRKFSFYIEDTGHEYRYPDSHVKILNKATTNGEPIYFIGVEDLHDGPSQYNDILFVMQYAGEGEWRFDGRLTGGYWKKIYFEKNNNEKMLVARYFDRVSIIFSWNEITDEVEMSKDGLIFNTRSLKLKDNPSPVEPHELQRIKVYVSETGETIKWGDSGCKLIAVQNPNASSPMHFVFFFNVDTGILFLNHEKFWEQNKYCTEGKYMGNPKHSITFYWKRDAGWAQIGDRYNSWWWFTFDWDADTDEITLGQWWK